MVVYMVHVFVLVCGVHGALYCILYCLAVLYCVAVLYCFVFKCISN